MNGLAGPVGTGIPNAYPLALNQPLDRAYLRPLQEPLYDTEVFNFTTPPSSMTYYQRPISQTDASGLITKTEAETNLNQSSMLDYPREFSILGFNIAMDSTIGLKTSTLIYRRAFFQFTFSGRRPYLQIPLHRIPQGQSVQGAIASTIAVGAGQSGSQAFGGMGMAHIANYYKFNLGRSALKIKPGEAFNGKISFPQAFSAGGAGTYGIDTTLNSNMGQTAASPAGWYIALMTVGLQWSPL